MTITLDPSTPSAPLLIVASDAKITTLFPLISPVTAIIPQSVRGIKNSYFPASTKRAIRLSGSRSSSFGVDTYMLLNTNTTLWPPKPKESLSAAISPAGNARGLSRTTSTVTAGSKFSMLIVGGAKRS